MALCTASVLNQPGPGPEAEPCDECPVCLDAMTAPVTLTCGHRLNAGCARRLRDARCPLCRAPLAAAQAAGREARQLRLAVRRNLGGLVRVLIEQGVEIGRPDTRGETPIQLAARVGALAAFDALRAAGAALAGKVDAALFLDDDVDLPSDDDDE